MPSKRCPPTHKIKQADTIDGWLSLTADPIYEWELMIAIPFEIMGLNAESLPDKIKGNFYKCADDTANPHYVTWSPIGLPSPDYHCPEYFGDILF
jgi:hypothetical protein